MAIKPSQLHALAKTQSTRSGEAWRRSAISRAYYASYHACQAWEDRLPRLGKAEPLTFGSHQQLIERLLSPDPRCTGSQMACSRKLGELLLKQKVLRVKADYRLPVTVVPKELEAQLSAVDWVFRLCAG